MTSTTICLLAKNEERAIAEWLAYQFVIGFDRIIVYDNGSTDATPEIIKEVAKREGRIDYVHWPDAPGRRPQTTAYSDAILRCTTDWIAFFDTDEFLVPKRHDSVNALLADMPADVSAVAINWLVFGSAGRIEAGNGLVIDRFTRCARHYGTVKNHIAKSILRPQAVEQMLVHTARLKYGLYVNSLGQEILIKQDSKTPNVCHEGAQLNHYLLKSREEFTLKMARGHASRPAEDKDKFHIDETFWAAHDLNDGEDLTIGNWRDALCAKLKSWGMQP